MAKPWLLWVKKPRKEIHPFKLVINKILIDNVNWTGVIECKERSY